MTVEERVRREVLFRELVKDPWLSHCFIAIEDSKKLYCRTYLGVACADIRPDYRWGYLSMEYRTPVAAFAISRIWSRLSEDEQGEWLELVEKWTAPVYKKISAGDAVKALIRSTDIKALARELGLSYNIVYQNVRPKLAAFEAMERLTPIMDTRSAHQKTLAHLQEPRRIGESQILGCGGFLGNQEECEDARAAFYEWLDPECGEYPDFSEEYLAARLKSQFDYVEERHTIEGWEFRQSVD